LKGCIFHLPHRLAGLSDAAIDESQLEIFADMSERDLALYFLGFNDAISTIDCNVPADQYGSVIAATQTLLWLMQKISEEKLKKDAKS